MEGNKMYVYLGLLIVAIIGWSSSNLFRMPEDNVIEQVGETAFYELTNVETDFTPETEEEDTDENRMVP